MVESQLIFYEKKLQNVNIMQDASIIKGLYCRTNVKLQFPRLILEWQLHAQLFIEYNPMKTKFSF